MLQWPFSRASNKLKIDTTQLSTSNFELVWWEVQLPSQSQAWNFKLETVYPLPYSSSFTVVSAVDKPPFFLDLGLGAKGFRLRALAGNNNNFDGTDIRIFQIYGCYCFDCYRCGGCFIIMDSPKLGLLFLVLWALSGWAEGGPSVKIGSFNADTLGRTKFSKDGVIATLCKVCVCVCW